MDDVLKVICLKMAQHKEVPVQLRKYTPVVIKDTITFVFINRNAQKIFNHLNP